MDCNRSSTFKKGWKIDIIHYGRDHQSFIDTFKFVVHNENLKITGISKFQDFHFIFRKFTDNDMSNGMPSIDVELVALEHSHNIVVESNYTPSMMELNDFNPNVPVNMTKARYSITELFTNNEKDIVYIEKEADLSVLEHLQAIKEKQQANVDEWREKVKDRKQKPVANTNVIQLAV